MLGAYYAYLFQYGERLVDRAERHARVLALDDQVDVLGGRVSLRPERASRTALRWEVRV